MHMIKISIAIAITCTCTRTCDHELWKLPSHKAQHGSALHSCACAHTVHHPDDVVTRPARYMHAQMNKNASGDTVVVAAAAETDYVDERGRSCWAILQEIRVRSRKQLDGHELSIAFQHLRVKVSQCSSTCLPAPCPTSTTSAVWQQGQQPGWQPQRSSRGSASNSRHSSPEQHKQHTKHQTPTADTLASYNNDSHSNGNSHSNTQDAHLKHQMGIGPQFGFVHGQHRRIPTGCASTPLLWFRSLEHDTGMSKRGHGTRARRDKA
jgi:hypothetical protein